MATNDSLSHVGAAVYWVTVTIRDPAAGVGTRLRWADLPWFVRTKWDWYVKYRAALAQVQHPRLLVELAWGSAPATGRQLARHRQNVRRAKKAKISEITNKLGQARAHWHNLFPIEQDPLWDRAVAKLDRLKAELLELENEAA